MTQIFETILTMSLSASALALLVLGARALIGRRQTILLSILFAMLIVKLILPLSIESPASIQNLFALQNESYALHNNQSSSIIPQIFAESVNNNAPNTDIQTEESQESQSMEAEILGTEASALPKAWEPSALEIGAIVWLSGIALFASYIAINNIHFMHKIRKNRVYSAPLFDTLLEECKDTFGVTQRISVICVSEINTAAVYGIFRPKLLISPRTFDSLSLQEKRHIIMHELSHIKRKDTLACLILTILNIVHWFNPILWIAFILMRKDLEIMCDAKVLRKIGQAERYNYAATLLHLIKKTNTKNVRLVTALFMSKTSIKRRIIMIAKYKKNSPLFVAMALLITIAVAITGCTTGMTDLTDADVQEPEKTAHASINETESTTETDNTVASQLELINTFSFDFSSFADNEARVENLRKAAHLFNKTIIKSKEDNGFIYDMSITIENGWFEAPSISWENYMNVMKESQWAPQASDTEQFETIQIGGGIDLVFGAIYKAFLQANIQGVELGFFEDDFFKGGDLVISNGNTDILLYTIVEDTDLIVEVYGDPALVPKVITPEFEPVLMTSFTLDYSNHAVTNTLYNIEKALNALQGTVITPGTEFSLNELLGPRNKAAGWKEAAGVSGGAFVTQYGVGVCAVASALYNAALSAELEIVDSSRHSILSDYVPGGLDATISTGGPDLVIKNPYDIGVMIEGSMEDGLVTIDIYGPPMDYTVDFTSEQISTEDAPKPVYYYNVETTPDGQSISKGQSITYINSRRGLAYQVYKTWYDLKGTEIKTEKFYYHSYRSITGRIYVNGPDPAE